MAISVPAGAVQPTSRPRSDLASAAELSSEPSATPRCAATRRSPATSRSPTPPQAKTAARTTQKKRAILKRGEVAAKEYEDAVRAETKKLQDFLCVRCSQAFQAELRLTVERRGQRRASRSRRDCSPRWMRLGRSSTRSCS